MRPSRSFTFLLFLLATFAVLATPGRAQGSLPSQLFFHGPGTFLGTAVNCMDAVPGSTRPRATLDHADAWFETRRGDQPSTDCATPALPAEIPAGTKLQAYIWVTLTGDFTTVHYVFEVVAPGAPTVELGLVAQSPDLGWNRAELITDGDVTVPAGGFLRVKVLQVHPQGVLRHDVDDVFPPTDGLSGPQGYPGLELIEPPEVELLVGNFASTVLRYDGSTGAFFDEFVAAGTAGLDVSLGIAVGPEGHLYVSSRNTDNVLKFHGATGEFLARFNPGAVLDEPTGLAFGPDGYLYVASAATDSILRFDPMTTLLIDVFADGGPLNLPEGLAFGPGGDLYVSSALGDAVLHYDGAGNLLGTFASGGGLDHPIGVTFGPDGHLYVGSANTDQILRYHGDSGAFLGVFASGGGLAVPIGLRFGPGGDLYVVSQANDRLLRYDGDTGAFLGVFASGSGGDLWTWFTFRPDLSGLLFADGFESGDVSEWSASAP